ncbi:Zn-dependent hydrolase [Pseudomonas sp. Marseille-QA0892]
MFNVNGERLWNSLMAMADIGPTERGGNCRLALSEEDRLGRELFSDWCRAAGMTFSVDPIGNLYARRAGRENVPPVVMGSHLDTQPKGGRFDGIFGVLAGLEVIRTLEERGIVTQKPLEIAVWTNEEGARFTPAMLGSAVFAGKLALDEALAIRDREGVSIQDALKQSGYVATQPLGRAFDAYFEAHIEQGPVLEADGLPIGVVTGGQAIAWLDIHVQGVAAHAGTTPMAMRKDAMFGIAEMLAALETLAGDFAPKGLVTVGQLDIARSSRNTIAADVRFTLDLRHHEDNVLAKMDDAARAVMSRIAEDRRLEIDIQQHWLSPATPFDTDCIDAVRHAVKALGYPHRDIVSGAGHDAIHLAKHCPTTMIFIPCKDGLSHNEAEYAAPEDVRMGADVLLNAVLERAGYQEI